MIQKLNGVNSAAKAATDFEKYDLVQSYFVLSKMPGPWLSAKATCWGF